MSQPESLTPGNVALDPVDWFLAGWRKLPPLPLPETIPFDRADCMKRLGKVRLLSRGWSWKGAEIQPAMTAEEGRFWLWTMVYAHGQLGARELGSVMRKQEAEEPPTIYKMAEGFGASNAGVVPELAPVLCAIFSLEGFVRTYLEFWPVSDQQRKIAGQIAGAHAQTICAGFLHHVRPYLTREQLTSLQEIVRPLFRERFEQSKWVPYALALLARSLDLHEEIEMLVSSWPDGSFGVTQLKAGMDADLLFGLGGADTFLRHMHRLGMHLTRPDHLRAFLAHTGSSQPRLICEHIKHHVYRGAADDMVEVFSLIETPEMAPLMLELIQANKGGVPARRWLDAHPEMAVEGLLPLAGERGELGDSALAFLRDAVRAGHGAIVEAKLAAAGGGVAERVRKALQTASAQAALALDDNSLPEWFDRGKPVGKVKLPTWLDAAAVEPITLAGRALAPEHMTSVLAALKESSLEAPTPLVQDLKKHADRASLEEFTWDLFERWQAADAPSKDKWAMTALGLLGGDGVCLKLWPLVRDWPGKGQHKRAVHGLECLRAIGSEQALLQLRKISDKVRFPALKGQAEKFMQEIADERGLTPAQLEDRIVPDLGLDEQGTRLLDYGARQFRIALGPDLKPRVREESGNIRMEMPKPTAKDDATKAAAAQADWKLFKQQLKEVIKTQAERLEKAMMRRRRWSVAEFEKYLIHHPLMRYLTRVVLWAGFDAQGKVLSTFRVTEDNTYADKNGEPLALDEQWMLGVVHPILLSREDLEKWPEVFADHEILPPFAQLGRKMFILESAEASEKVLKRFEGLKVPGMALLGATKKTGWDQGPANDHYKVTSHYKHFPEASLTAFMTYQPGLEAYSYGYGGAEDQEFGVAYFVSGGHEGVRTATQEQALPLGEVDVLVLNEVATLMYALSGKKG